MAKRSLSVELDELVEAVLARREAASPPAASRLAPMVRIAAGLRDLPRQGFRARLKAELQRRGPMTSKVTPVPEGFHTATPFLIVPDGAAAIDFYKRAFGAIETARHTDPGGKIMYAEVQIGDSRIMMGEHKEVGAVTPEALPPVSIYLYVEDVDALFDRAAAAGAKVLYPVRNQFYGNREGGLADPFGIVWWIATRNEVLSPEELRKRAPERGGH